MTYITTTRIQTQRRKTPILRLWELARQRHQLAKLTQGQLEDIGLTRAEAETEANRSFWDAPDSWKIR